MANYKVSITLDAQDKASPAFKELNKQLDQTKRGAADINQSSGGLLDRFGGLTGVVTAAAGAFAALQLGQKILELRDLGAAATAAGNTFEQLSGGAIAARANLDAMRAATRGVVDDTTLMGGANRLLLMNLASTGEEAAKLTGIAVALGRAMGQDAGTAVADFASLLANQSIPRLDNFGISSANVRARIEELTTGMNALSREAAFTQAVLEEGESSMTRLGSSIDANASQWDRLMTRLGNARDALGQGVFSVGETLAGGLNNVVTALEGPVAAMEDLAARVTALETGQVVGANGAPPIGENTPGFNQLTEEQIQRINESMSLIVRPGEDISVIADPRDVAARIVEEMFGEAFDAQNARDAAVEALVRSFGQAAASETFPELMDRAAAAWEQRWGDVDTLSSVAELESAIAGLVGDYVPTRDQRAQAEDYIASLNAQRLSGISGAGVTDYSGYTGPTGPGFVSMTADRWMLSQQSNERLQREMAFEQYRDAILQAYGPAAQSITPRLNLDEMLSQQQQAQIDQRNNRQYSENMWQSYGIVRENQQRQAAGEWAAQGILDLWGGLTERGTQIANSFRDAVESAQTIQSKLGEAGDKLATSLSGVLNLGVTGGFQGDVYSQIAQLITDESARQQFELGTGLSTTGQRAFSEVAGIIAGMGGQEQIDAAQGLAAFMQSGMFRPDMTTADIMGQLGYMGKPGGQQFQVFAGDTYADLQARYGLNAQQVMNAAGITNSRLLQVGTYGAGDEYTQFTMGRNMGDKGGGENQNPMRVLAEDAQKANDEIAQVQTALDEINGTTASVKIKLEADDSALPAVLRELMRFGSLAQAFEGVANKNGGTVPGGNARAQAGRMGEKR